MGCQFFSAGFYRLKFLQGLYCLPWGRRSCRSQRDSGNVWCKVPRSKSLYLQEISRRKYGKHEDVAIKKCKNNIITRLLNRERYHDRDQCRRTSQSPANRRKAFLPWPERTVSPLQPKRNPKICLVCVSEATKPKKGYIGLLQLWSTREIRKIFRCGITILWEFTDRLVLD